jgi:hypothetical protein
VLWARYPVQTGPAFLIEQFEQPVVDILKAVVQAIRGGNRLYANY